MSERVSVRDGVRFAGLLDGDLTRRVHSDFHYGYDFGSLSSRAAAERAGQAFRVVAVLVAS